MSRRNQHSSMGPVTKKTTMSWCQGRLIATVCLKDFPTLTFEQIKWVTIGILNLRTIEEDRSCHALVPENHRLIQVKGKNMNQRREVVHHQRVGYLGKTYTLLPLYSCTGLDSIRCLHCRHQMRIRRKSWDILHMTFLGKLLKRYDDKIKSTLEFPVFKLTHFYSPRRRYHYAWKVIKVTMVVGSQDVLIVLRLNLLKEISLTKETSKMQYLKRS